MPNVYYPPRPDFNPRIYAYTSTHQDLKGYLKVGETKRTVEERTSEQNIKAPIKWLDIVLDESAISKDGTVFRDTTVRDRLRLKGFKTFRHDNEWVKCSVEDVLNVIRELQEGKKFELSRTQNYKMRPEQEAAVLKTMEYYRSFKAENPDKTPHFLWNAKMRFGKTFTTYQLAKRMNLKRVLILTFKPAVMDSWKEDLLTHIDFDGWQFVHEGYLSYEDADKTRPIVCFGSFQDFLGKKDGKVKEKNLWVHKTDWDLVVFDEYHYGAWRENAQDLFAKDEKEESKMEWEGLDDFDEDLLPINSSYYLYLSGTPFRAIASGEFIEEQVYNWTYSDEQRAKNEWVGPDNPYRMLPRLVMLTYSLPKSAFSIAVGGEFDEFDLNEFFRAEGSNVNAHFVHEDDVQRWLEIICGKRDASSIDELKMGAQKPDLPFSSVWFKALLTHTLWFLPSVSSCFAMNNLLQMRHNRSLFIGYKIIVAAGPGAGIGVEALRPVQEAMEDALNSKTITLTCGKLTTGVTVRPWSGILMLRNIQTPETYFQAAFRVQSPWVVRKENPNDYEIIKEECYVFDFAPNRALRQIADYSCRLNVDDVSPEYKVREFIKFLPVLAFNGMRMKELGPEEVLDQAMSGTSATLLARRWESALLVNVDNNTLTKLMANERAMAALMSIEGFRSLNKDIQTIINKSEAIKKAKTKKLEGEFKKKDDDELKQAQKEYMTLRKQIQDKLIKFATRIPVFMYLTDERECTLKDVITQLEPALFKKVTGLEVSDFELLVSLNLFNGPLMNEAVYSFKRYEDSSLEYVGIRRHFEEEIGGFDTVVGAVEFESSMGVGRSYSVDDIIDCAMGQTSFSVTQRVETIRQPRGGLIPADSMECISFHDGNELLNENISPSIIGLAVDYLTRFMLGQDIYDAFRVSLDGGLRSPNPLEVSDYVGEISGLDDYSIISACRAVSFDSYYRAGEAPSIKPSELSPSASTCENIRIMVNRSISFLNKYGPVTVFGPRFDGGYSSTIPAGDGDFVTDDTIWDFKTSKNEPSSQHTLQVAVYYCMSKHSDDERLKKITKIGIFNPRLNKAYIKDMSTVDQSLIDVIEKEIIRY